jgi:hypothetical protein
VKIRTADRDHARVLRGTKVPIEIRLANLPGGDSNFAFYERETIYIDGQIDPAGNLCRGVTTLPHV